MSHEFYFFPILWIEFPPYSETKHYAHIKECISRVLKILLINGHDRANGRNFLLWNLQPAQRTDVLASSFTTSMHNNVTSMEYFKKRRLILNGRKHVNT